MDQFHGDFNQYSTAFRLAQVWSSIKADNILVDALQWGVTNQLATMMTTAALPTGQEKTGCKWKQWLDKAGKFYWNVVILKKLRGGDSYIQQAQPTRLAHPRQDPNTMEVDRVKLSPREQVEHMRDYKCFICHKVGCHSAGHPGYPGGKRSPQWTPPFTGCFQRTNEVASNLRIDTYINKKDVTTNQVMTILEAASGAEEEEGAKEWSTEEESVNQISTPQGF